MHQFSSDVENLTCLESYKEHVTFSLRVSILIQYENFGSNIIDVYMSNLTKC